jgi:hypothetical protein
MIELYLLAYLRPDIYSSNESESKALEHVSQLAKVAEGTFELYSARRQIERYKEWFFQYEEIGRLLPLVDKILDAMPDIDTC